MMSSGGTLVHHEEVVASSQRSLSLSSCSASRVGKKRNGLDSYVHGEHERHEEVVSSSSSSSPSSFL